MALGEQETSPKSTAVRGGPGAPSSSSKPGGSAFPPPVGRFPGDASNGQNNWNARSQGMSRTNGAGGNADGISNYGGGALNRRSSTPGKPPVAGACGLVNVGNTCYLNSAVQCLSHTPLVRAYLLSDMWAAEVNKYNPLGTQVKLPCQGNRFPHCRVAVFYVAFCRSIVPWLIMVYFYSVCFSVYICPPLQLIVGTVRCVFGSLLAPLFSEYFLRHQL